MPKKQETEISQTVESTEKSAPLTFENPSDFEKVVMMLLQREGWKATLPPKNAKGYDIELKDNGATVAVQVKNHRSRIGVGHIQRFLNFLANSQDRFSQGFFISANGFTEAVGEYLREEKTDNLRLGTFGGDKVIWDDDKLPEQSETTRKVTYIGVFTCKGGVGKTTVSAHLAGAFAMNDYEDVALIDLDPQSNLKKLLGDSIFLPKTKEGAGSVVSVLNHDEWDENLNRDVNVVICDCNPEFEVNPRELIEKFDYCIIPTTLNPLGINKNADVIVRTFDKIRSVNKNAKMFVLINNFRKSDSPTQEKRNQTLNELLKQEFVKLRLDDPNAIYIDPLDEVAIRSSDQLYYWGEHLLRDGTDKRPQFAFEFHGGRSHPRDDFDSLVSYLEDHTEIERQRGNQTT